jgi:hypothetical protein
MNEVLALKYVYAHYINTFTQIKTGKTICNKMKAVLYYDLEDKNTKCRSNFDQVDSWNEDSIMFLLH